MNLIYTAPWWLWGLPAAAGAAMLFAGLRKGDRTLWRVGLGIVLAAAAVFIVSSVVESDEEKVTQLSRELAEAVGASNWTTVERILAPDATVSLSGVGNIYTSRNDILKAARRRNDASGSVNVNLTSVTPTREGGQLVTNAVIFVATQNLGGQPVMTEWRFVWREIDGGFELSDIEAVRFANSHPADMKHWFPSAR